MYDRMFIVCRLLMPLLAFGHAHAESPQSASIEVGRCTVRLLDEVILACDRPGIVSFVESREGSTVRAGQVIAGLQDDVARAALATATKEAENDIDIRYAEKAVEVAEVEHQRALEANRLTAPQKAIPEIEVRRLKLAAEKSRLELEGARHRFAVNQLKRAEAEAQWQTYRITAPFDGTITRVHRAKGEAVRQGDQMLELASTQRVRVEGAISLADSWRVQPGDDVRVTLDHPAIAPEPLEREGFRGKLIFVDVKVEPVNQQVRVWAEVDNPGNVLRAGMQAKMAIEPRYRTAAAGS